MPASDMQNEVTATTKWRGLLVNALKKVGKQVQPSLTIAPDALIYLEELIIQLMYLICASLPHTITDVEERVQKTFPQQINDWAIGFAKGTIEKGKKKKGLTLPFDKIHPFLCKEVLGYKIENMTSTYIVAILEYISSDILVLAGNYVKNIRHNEITCQDIKVAMQADKVLMDMFHGDEMEPTIETRFEPLAKRGSLLYEDILKDFLMSEDQYIRELNLLIKVFRQQLLDVESVSEEDVDSIFSNIMDIHETTIQFYSMLEAAVEMADEDSLSKKSPLVGDCFEEMAEAAEFEVYENYALEITTNGHGFSKHLDVKIRDIINRPGVAEHFEASMKSFFKYILPKLVYIPVFHCLEYFEYMNLLMSTSPNGEDREKLDEAMGALRGLQVSLDRIGSGNSFKTKAEDRIFYQRRIGTISSSPTSKLNDIQRSIDGWEGKDICQCASEFLKEGQMYKIVPGGKKGFTDRYLFLFDSLLVLTKQNARHSITGLISAEHKLKEKFFLRKVEIRDLEDTEEYSNAFEIVPKEQPSCILYCKTAEEKSAWLAVLFTLLYRSQPVCLLWEDLPTPSELHQTLLCFMLSTLDRMLDAILVDEEQLSQNQWKIPDQYCFAVEDSEGNIVFEEGQEDRAVPVLKGGTLLKLVERLTYHKYADPTFVRIFLTTYRSFCSPTEFLDLLVKRYEIPEPLPSDKDQMALQRGHAMVREDLKRFRKEYAQPVQLRVLNVIRQWVDQHFYDFEREPELLKKLEDFFSRIRRSKAVKKWVESIDKIVQRRKESMTFSPEHSFSHPTPPVEWHLTLEPDKFDILTLHPLEIGRQLTLLQSEMFRSIKASELVGVAWTKKDKEVLSPNALRMIRFSNKVTYWFEQSIIEAQNFEERVAVVSRIIEILLVFQDLNNFNGMMEVVSALNSAPIFRLHLTFAEIPPKRIQALEEAKELADTHSKKYVEKLRSINPPCVPFLGMYLTNILKIEEGNPDFIRNMDEGIINFTKRRMVADITGEIQQYQNQPYNLQTEPSIRAFFEDLNPFSEMSEKNVNDVLYDGSLTIEPRGSKQPPKFPRKTDISLKSPGIKTSKSSTSGRKISLSSISSESFEMINSPARKHGASLSLSDISENEERLSNGGGLDKNSSSFAGSPEPIKESPEEEIAPPPRVPPRKPSAEIGNITPRRSGRQRLWSAEEDGHTSPPTLPPRPARASSMVLQSPETPPPVTPFRRNVPPPPLTPVPDVDAPPVPPRPPKTPLATPLDVFNKFDLPPPGTPPPVIPPKPGKNGQ